MCYGLRDRRVSEDLFECAEVVRAGESDESDGADGVGEVRSGQKWMEPLRLWLEVMPFQS